MSVQQTGSLRLQDTFGLNQPHSRIMLTPQRPGFQICGSVPSAVEFCGYVNQDVAHLQEDIVAQYYTLLSPFLPCPGEIRLHSDVCSVSAPALKFACAIRTQCMF